MAVQSENETRGQRLQVARAFSGLTQAELADRVSVSKQFISQIERGSKRPDPMTLAAIGETLGFGPGFFGTPFTERLDEKRIHFRSQQAATAAMRERAVSHGTLFISLVEYFDTRLRFHEDKFPFIKAVSDEEIERAAERCRMQWGLGLDTPILNVTRTLERAGAVVTCFQGYADRIDAFSHPGKRRIIVANREKGSPSRSVFDMAHECGHLVLHEGVLPGDEQSEAQANRFASAFLMPSAGFFRDFPRGIQMDWPALFRLKARWRVSVSAMIRRARDLSIISAVQYTRAYKYMSAQGWPKGEPEEFPYDPPEAIPRAFEAMEKYRSKRASDIARELDWSVSRLAEVAAIEVEGEDLAKSSVRTAAVQPNSRPVTLDLFRNDPANDRK
jgi:Zn-dependent peptidase ImmA (M78 family)/transcriptional regulator with XRE-family HTH domain